MNRKQLMSTTDLIACFREKKGLNTNNQKIDFRLHFSGKVEATHIIKADLAKGYRLDLITEYESVKQFIELNEFASVGDIHHISGGNLSARYITGIARVYADIIKITRN